MSPKRTRQKMVSSSRMQKNPSLVCLENILKLPKINKEYKVDIIDDNFTIRYFENKKRVELTYRQRNQQEPIPAERDTSHDYQKFNMTQETRMVAGMTYK
jgi:hypothetical protein